MAESNDRKISQDIRDKVDEWMELDKNDTTRSEIQSLALNGNESELRNRLCTRMSFGTAGLRAKMGAGYNMMNDLTVIQTTQGFSKYLVRSFGKEACLQRGVVVGYDARHNSERFSKLVASVLVSQDVKVFLFSRVTPTPFTPFCVRKWSCLAGIMITASHNPKQDNGYKVYWSNGAQIISPHDKEISSSIGDNLIPWPTSWSISSLSSHPLIQDPYHQISNEYFSSLLQYSYHHHDNHLSPITCVYTPMHGVGYPFVQQAFEAFHLPPPVPVTLQVEPDPDFPTVVYPNPEEGRSALDLAMETADRHGHVIIIANDPDADRLALAEKQSGNGVKDSYWRVFTGNEIGAILGWWALDNYKMKKKDQFDGSKVHMISTAVSSKILKSMADIEGFQFQETLTGFKWMGNVSHDLIERGEEVLFAFEEAIGFMFGSMVLDKDGVSSAAVVGEMAGYLYRNGRSFASLLDDVYTKYGRVLSHNSYFICNSKDTISELFENLRKNKKYPETCGNSSVVSICDLTVGYDSTRPPDYKPVLPVDPNSQMITFTLDNHCIFTLRTSGTEPKIKYYVYMTFPPGTIKSEMSLRATLDKTVKDIINEFLRPDHYKLIARSI